MYVAYCRGFTIGKADGFKYILVYSEKNHEHDKDHKKY